MRLMALGGAVVTLTTVALIHVSMQHRSTQLSYEIGRQRETLRAMRQQTDALDLRVRCKYDPVRVYDAVVKLRRRPLPDVLPVEL